MDAKQLHELGEELFGKRLPLVTLWQEIAENFYPERADFTIRRSNGTDFAANLMTSYPVLCRRDLANQFSTMLRPTAKPWFHLGRKYMEDRDQDATESNQYLQWFERTMRRAMYDKAALFNRATKEADDDFAAFGQACISVETDRAGNTLLYRAWHLRDMAWQENEVGQIGAKFRRWKPTAQTAVRAFPGKMNEKIVLMSEKTPFEPVELMHMVVESDMYDTATPKPRWSIWYDCMNGEVIEETGIWGQHYIIPRWATVSSTVFGSQYAYSPAVVAALPDARLIQAMTYTILEAGEKATSPPIIATQDAVRSDVALYAGGITWVDQEYDERLGEALRPLTQDFRGFNFGIELGQSAQSMIRKAFYLDTLTIPQRAPEMTAYEVGQRIQEYIRNALPLFEPVETEYNAAICEETFSIMRRAGAFGSPADWPKELQATEFQFHFESPLHDTIEEQKAQKIMQAQPLIGAIVPLDPSAAYIMDAGKALRDALSGTIPADWVRTDAKVQEMLAAAAKQKQQQDMLAAMQQGAATAKDAATAQATMNGSQAAGPSIPAQGMPA